MGYNFVLFLTLSATVSAPTNDQSHHSISSGPFPAFGFIFKIPDGHLQLVVYKNEHLLGEPTG